MADDYDFSGVWRSSYRYKSSGREGEYENVHYVTMYTKDNQLVIESVPNEDQAYLLARFSLDGRVATGSWQEQMPEHSYYDGMLYHGAAQLVLDTDKHALRGKWVGFGKKMEVKTGTWEIVKTDKPAPKNWEVSHKVAE